MGDNAIVLLLVVRQTSCDHRQLHDSNESASTTSAVQRAQRTDTAMDRAVNTLRDNQKAFQAAVIRISYLVLGPSVEAQGRDFVLALDVEAVDPDRHWSAV